MRVLIVTCLFLLFVACNTPVKQRKSVSNDEVKLAIDSMLADVPEAYWKITGTEPFWNIYMHNDTILFTMLNEKIDTVFFIQEGFTGVNTHSEYKLTDNEKNSATLIINGGKCSDGMSDNVYEYSAIFTYKDKVLKGCAKYANYGR
jgi:uncharacterized membrane protein